MSGRDDEVGPLAGLERADLIGDPEESAPGRCVTDWMRRVFGEPEGDGGGRLVGEVSQGGGRGGPATLRTDGEGYARGMELRRRWHKAASYGSCSVRGKWSVPPSRTGTFAFWSASATFQASAAPEITALSFSSLASSRASRIST